MSLIKAPERIEKRVISVSVPEPLIEELDAYAKWIKAERVHVICESIKFTLANDQEWQQRKNRPKPVTESAA